MQITLPDHWPIYDGDLGCKLNAQSTTFTLWAPTASSVTLRLFVSGSNSEPKQTHQLQPARDGAWSVTIAKRLDGIYYDYLVSFADGSTNRTSDPWGVASGVNALRSLIIDDTRVCPAHWDTDVAPEFNRHATVVWETHVADFSSDPHGGFKPEYRKQYLAFTQTDTCLHSDNGTAQDFPTGVNYLKQFGVTHVQLEPIYDFATIDEAQIHAADATTDVDQLYNWGYDPAQYNVPEGAYASDPHDGTVRIRECKAMIAALHKSGLRVVMDVVYNHMFASAQNAFESVAPGYFCRRNEDGSFSNGSGCGNDMASERPMFRRFIIESLVHWARDYHIDGFRFDLMGLIDTDTLNLARKALDELDGGKDILMYGEPWGAGPTVNEGHLFFGDKAGRGHLDERIGWFSDETRDTLKGHVLDHHARGFVNGNEYWTHDAARNALNGWRDTPSAGKSVGQIIQYVSAHDDLTLWDKLCISMRENPSQEDFLAQTPDNNACLADIVNANMLAAGMILASAGIPFLLSGEEFGRTKMGDDNSYRSGVLINQLDWCRAQRFMPLVDWYRTLIALRREYPALYDGERHYLPVPEDPIIAVRIGEDLIVCVNPIQDHAVTLSLPTDDADGAQQAWHCVADSNNYYSQWAGCSQVERAQLMTGESGENTVLRLPSRTFAVLANR